MNYTLEEINYTPPKKMSCRYLMPNQSETDNLHILILSVKGVYPEGSLGNPYGEYIAQQALCGLVMFDPECLILDFRDMEYTWGNTLALVYQNIDEMKNVEMEPDEPPFPVLTVISDKCKTAFLSLVTPTGAELPEGIYSDLDEAVTQGIYLARDWLNYI